MSTPTLDRVLDAVLRVEANYDIRFISEPGQRWFTKPLGAELPHNFLATLHPDDVAVFQQAQAAAHDGFSCDLRLLRDQAATSGEGGQQRNLRDDLPPHY